MSALEQFLAAIEAKTGPPCASGLGYAARCPAHDDQNPSLSISSGQDGKVLLHCHAGCPPERICSALGLSLRSLFESVPGSVGCPPPTFEAFCLERGLDRSRLHTVWGVHSVTHGRRPAIRYPTPLGIDRVKFLDGRPPKYLWAERGRGRPHWYGLSQAIELGGEALYLVNGEPSTWAANQARVPSVCLCAGEGAVPDPLLIAQIKGTPFIRVVVVYDLDQAGRAGAIRVAMALRDAGMEARAVELPSYLGEHGDVGDLARWTGSLLPRALQGLPELAPPDPPGVLLSEVAPRPVRWLWPGRIPLGKVTVLDGDPGCGKSTLALDLLARVTKGERMPDGASTPKGGGVYASAEDDYADTLVPRLKAAGADLRRIRGLSTSTSPNGLERPLSIPEDIPLLETAIRATGAIICVLDPIMAFLGDGVDSHVDHDVRRALTPLGALAARTDCAILMIRHLSKKQGGPALYRGAGSIGIIGAARSGLVVSRDPGDESVRVLASTKCNLGKEPPSLAFTLDEVALDGVGQVVRARWLGGSVLSADLLLSPAESREERSQVEETAAFLRDALQAGPKPVRELLKEMGEMGFSRRTAFRAREKGLVNFWPYKVEGIWCWQLRPKEKPAQMAHMAHLT